MKRTYIKPEMESVELMMNDSVLLNGSPISIDNSAANAIGGNEFLGNYESQIDVWN